MRKAFSTKSDRDGEKKYGDDRSGDYSFGEEEEPDQLLFICPFFSLVVNA